MEKIKKASKEDSACFTGHRPASMPWGYNENHKDCIALKTKLKEILIKLIDTGVTTFYNGLAEGFDLYAAEILVNLKRDGFPIYLVGAIPCGNQSSTFRESSKELYNQMLESFDELYFVTRGHYFNGCTFIRNKYMVDNSSILIAYVHKETGGSASTLKYAKKQNLDIINL